jgi:hypothetical protein
MVVKGGWKIKVTISATCSGHTLDRSSRAVGARFSLSVHSQEGGFKREFLIDLHCTHPEIHQKEEEQ